ncbi:glycosyltransferase [Leifsonia sp. NPDC058230]|uniref:glycosyltransferase family protein n=1 Tax=Leifsonia sp. NPDC058230 TaxID=3346391 RepID=UPI0036DB9190
MTTTDAGAKPRMVYFRWTRPGLPAFLQGHVSEQLATLEQFFDIVVIDRDCDYGRICDAYQPDLSVFESGVYAGDRSISNTTSHPEIPKLGFLHADAFDSSRAAFVADMARWNVDWFFTTSMSMAEYTPEIADRLFVWPNAVDPAVFHDYGLPKNIPVLFTGSQAWHYPWRNAVSRAVTPEFITTTMPHFGWGQARGTERMVRGEEYARLLNSSVFVPTCGTISRDLVRKHLEIPASMACLVTERTAAVEAFGFEDMVNCVFADASDVVDKLDQLLRNPDDLDRITLAGHRLVHERHTVAKRDQVRQWFELVREHGTGVRLRQTWPDGRLELATPDTDLLTGRVVGSGPDRVLLAQGWEAVDSGDIAAAERDFLRCINYYFMPEAAIGLAFTGLLRGDPAAAQDWVSRAIKASSTYGAAEPDPVQWATELRMLLCAGDLAAARIAAEKYPGMSHPELDRVRAAVAALTGAEVSDPGARPRASVCPPPDSTDEQWTLRLVAMLRACGQAGPAARLSEQHGTSSAESGTAPLPAVRAGWRGRFRVEARLARLRKGDSRSTAERWVRARLSPLKRRLTSDPWSRFVGDYAKREPVSTAVIVLGNDGWSRSARAVRSGLLENPAVREVTTFPSDSEPDAHARVDDQTSLYFVTSGGTALLGGSVALGRAATIIMEGVNEPSGQRILEDLIAGREFDLVDHRPEHGTGTVVLRRSSVGIQRKDNAR